MGILPFRLSDDCYHSFLNRVERKERARLKTVKFNAKPGSFDSKGVSDCESEAMV